jgi:hypothetical protein
VKKPVQYSEENALKAFSDVFGRTLRAAGAPTERLARGLGMSFPALRIQVGWQWSSTSDFTAHTWSEGRVAKENKKGLRALRSNWRKLLAEAASVVGAGLRLYRKDSSGTWSFAICRAPGTQPPRGILSLRLTGSAAQDPGILLRHTPSLVSFYYFVRTEASASFIQRLETLERSSGLGRSTKELESLGALLSDAKETLDGQDLVRFLMSATEVALAQLAGGGWDVGEGSRDPLELLLRALPEESSPKGSADPDLQNRLRLLFHFTPSATATPIPDHRGFALMAAWTHLLVRSRERLESEDKWDAAVTLTEKNLPGLLLGWSQIQQKPFSRRANAWRARAALPWLQLWFCLEMLHHPAPDSSSAYANRFRQALAYVVREGIRFFVFGSRTDYRVAPEELTQALETLVEYHASVVLQIPKAVNLRGLLELNVRLSGREVHSEGLESYLWGVFLVQLESGSPKHDLLAALISPGASLPSEPKRIEACWAFGLAALLGNLGRRLTTLTAVEAARLAELEEKTREWLQQADRSQFETTSRWLNETLDEAFDSAEGDWFRRWHETARTSTGVSEAIASTWWVSRWLASLELPASVKRSAIRATLLRGIPAATLRARTDPVAALLVLCGSLASWTHGRTRAEPNGPREVETLELLGLELWIKEGRVRGRFEAEWADRTSPILPRVRITLADSADRLRDPLAECWLLHRQNLGRVKLGLSEPWIEIDAKPSGYLAAAGLDSRHLLAEVADRAPMLLRPSLEVGLAELPSKVDLDGMERLAIEANGKTLHRGEISLYLAELEQIAEAVIREFEVEAHKRKNGAATRA